MQRTVGSASIIWTESFLVEEDGNKYHQRYFSLLHFFFFHLKMIELPYDPAIPLLGIHTKEDTCTLMFIAALFTIARTQKPRRCPSADEWIRELWYKYTMEYYSAIKKNAFKSVLMRWMKLEPIIQSEVRQKEKTPIQYTNIYIWNLERW